MYYKGKNVDAINFKQPEDKEHRFDYNNTTVDITSSLRGTVKIKDGR